MRSLKKFKRSRSKRSKMKEQPPPQQNVATLPIPLDVMYDNLFPYLYASDLLRLRRVSKQIKDISDKFIQHHLRVQEREINETDCTFASFIQRNLPTRALYLNNSGPEFFNDSVVPLFLRLYADGVTHLRVKHFSACASSAENSFFLAFTNLQHLELEHTDMSGGKRKLTFTYTEGKKKKRLNVENMWYFPSTFRNLKTLKLNTIRIVKVYEQTYAVQLFNFCTQLEHFKHPLHYLTSPLRTGTDNFTVNGDDFVFNGASKRMLENHRERLTLKMYDLEHRPEIPCWDLIKLCFHTNMKLLNFNSILYDQEIDSTRPDEEIYGFFSKPIVSVKNVNRNMFWTEMPNLESVVITSTAGCSFDKYWEEDDHPQWPKLSMLDINIDSVMLAESEDHPAKPTTALFNFLFSSTERENLKDLRIRFDQDRLSTGCVCRMALPYPRAVDIAKSCINVTKLTLSNWMGTSNSIAKFWNGLPELIEVTIEKCKLLEENAAFVGKNTRDPAFLKLKKLKKLALKGLDLMPKITDEIFITVFCNLTIEEFEITSKTALKSITINGIRSLVSGAFNCTVSKFCFDGWTLQGVSKQEFADLKSKFRASYML